MASERKRSGYILKQSRQLVDFLQNIVKSDEDDVVLAILSQDLKLLREKWKSDYIHWRHKLCGLTCLHLAVMTGNVTAVTFLVDSGTDVNKTAYSDDPLVKSYKNLSCLHLAVLCNHRDILELLLEKGAHTEDYFILSSKLRDKFKGLNGKTPFHFAVIRRDFNAMEILKKYNASVNASGMNGCTAVHLAALLNHDDILDYLLDNVPSSGTPLANEGITPMYLAAMRGSLKTLFALIKRGYSVNVTSTNKATPLHAAARFGHKDAIHMLCTAGANVDAVLNNNLNWKLDPSSRHTGSKRKALYQLTPLHIAIISRKIQCIRTLLKYGADPNARAIKLDDNSEITPLFLAVQKWKHSRSVCKLLLENGADVNTSYKTKHVLDLAIGKRDYSAVKYLLEQRTIDVNVVNPGTHLSPLMTAIKENNIDLVKWLLDHPSIQLEKGFRYDMPDIVLQGVTPLQLAVLVGNKEAVALLLERGADVHSKMSCLATRVQIAGSNITLMHNVAGWGHMNVFELLVDAGAPLEEMMSSGQMPLDTAVEENFGDVIRALLKLGVDPNGGNAPKTPLMHAAERNDLVLMNLLIQKGCNMERTHDETGCTALHFAINSGNLEAAHLLIDHGCDVQWTGNSVAPSPLVEAIVHADTRLVERLLKKGHNPNMTCMFNFEPSSLFYTVDEDAQPIHVAAFLGKVEMLDLLLRYGAHIDVCLKRGKMTPLHMAVAHKHHHAAAYLIRKGAKVSLNCEKVALFQSIDQNLCECIAASGMIDVLDLAVDFGAEVLPWSFGMSEGFARWINLPFGPNRDVTSLAGLMIQKLLGHGIQVYDQDIVSYMSQVRGLNPRTVSALLEHGAEVFFEDENPSFFYSNQRFKAIMDASSNDVVKLFMQYGINVQQQTSTNETVGGNLMHEAVLQNNVEALKILTTLGGNIDSKGMEGCPLHIAALSGKPSAVKFLLEAGASVEARTTVLALCHEGFEEMNILHYAVLSGHKEVLKAVLSTGVDLNAPCFWRTVTGVTPIIFATIKGCFKSVPVLCLYGCDVNARTSEGNTALHYLIPAAGYDPEIKVAAFRSLLSARCDVNVHGCEGLTPLMLAIISDDVNMTRELLACGSDVRATSDQVKSGELPTVCSTALHFAAEKGFVKGVKMLIEAGAPLDSREVRGTLGGFTPLHCAALRGFGEVVDLLTKAGCDMNAQTEDGLTPLHVAAMEGRLDVTKRLVKSEVNPKLKTKSGLLASNLALFPAIARLIVGYEAKWDLKHKRPTLNKRFSLQQRLSIQTIEAFSLE